MQATTQATMHQSFAIFLLNGGAQTIKLPDGTRLEPVENVWVVTRPDGSTKAFEYRGQAVGQAEIWGGHSHGGHCACCHWTQAN